MKAGRLVVRKQFAYFAVPLFRRAVASRTAKDCDDPDLQRSVVAALNLPPDDRLLGDARLIGGQLCWDKMHETLARELATSQRGSYFATNTCAFMTSKGAVGKTSPCYNGKP